MVRIVKQGCKVKILVSEDESLWAVRTQIELADREGDFDIELPNFLFK